MKAVQLVKYGDAVEGIEVRDLPDPAPPGPGEALVAIAYAPVNINDLMVVWGIYDWKPTPPEVLGNEGAGVVVAVGAGVDAVQPGDRVVLPLMARSWRERLVLPAADLVLLPPGSDLRQASMLTINPVTAALLLRDFVDLVPGDAVAFNLATSGIGTWIAGLARRRALHTVGLVRHESDVDKVRMAGCDDVVVDEEPIGDAAARLTGLKVRLALDGVGGSSAGRLAQLLAPRERW